MKYRKRIVRAFLLLIVSLFVGTSDSSVQAATTAEEWSYADAGIGKIEIAAHTGNATELVIPSEIDGKVVSSIGYDAFWGCTNLSGVAIPSRVTYICDGDEACQHEFVETITKAAGCTMDGEKEVACGKCGGYYVQTLPAVGHIPVIDAAIASTCTKEGMTQGRHCSICNEVLEKQTKLPVLEHAYEQIIKKATLDEEGSFTKKCTECGKVDEATFYTWSEPEKIWLSDKKYVYTGKSIKASVVLSAKDGTLIDKKYYDVSYKNNKNVGKATVTVTLKGDRYSGVLTENFNILPKDVSKFKTLDRGTNSITVGWKKQTKQITGFQIQYSKKVNFKGAKSVWVKNKKTTKKKIKGLQDDTPYYVRIRAYKTVKINGKTKKLYSGWSAANMARTKEYPVLNPHPTDAVWAGPYEMYVMHLGENGYPYFYSRRDGDVEGDSVQMGIIDACEKEGGRYVAVKNYAYNLGIGRWHWAAEFVGEYDGIIVIRRYVEILSYE